MSLYAANGSINVIVVDGDTLTGLHSPSGAWYVVIADPTELTTLHHPCGGLNVVLAPENTSVGRLAPCGAWYVTDDASRNDGLQRITVVSGDIGSAAIDAPTIANAAITGTAEAGETLTADEGDTTGTGTLFYQWLRNGTPIAGATEDTYDLTADDLNKYISVVVSIINNTGGQSDESNSVLVQAGSSDALLLETGDFILLETGDKLLKE